MHGLANVGNTCALNAVVQCIKACPSLRERLRGCAPFGSFAGELAQLLADLEVGTVSPGRFVPVARAMLQQRKIHPTAQQDLPELWTVFADQVGLELGGEGGDVAGWSSPSSVALAFAGLPPQLDALNKVAFEAWRSFASGADTAWTRASTSLAVAQMACPECGHASQRFEPATVLALDVPVSAEPVDLSQLFDAYLAAERVDGFQCAGCQKSVSAERLVRLWRAPHTLVLQLKRHNAHGAVVRTPVRVPRGFEMLPGTELMTAGPRRYELVAVGLHDGDVMSGHYRALVRNTAANGDGAWHAINDMAVMPVDPAAELGASRDAYLLFYHEVGPAAAAEA